MPIIFLFLLLCSLSKLCILPAITCNTRKYLNLSWYYLVFSEVEVIFLLSCSPPLLHTKLTLLVERFLLFIIHISVASKDVLYFPFHLFRLLACVCTKGTCCNYGGLIIHCSWKSLWACLNVCNRPVHSDAGLFKVIQRTHGRIENLTQIFRDIIQCLNQRPSLLLD